CCTLVGEFDMARQHSHLLVVRHVDRASRVARRSPVGAPWGLWRDTTPNPSEPDLGFRAEAQWPPLIARAHKEAKRATMAAMGVNVQERRHRGTAAAWTPRPSTTRVSRQHLARRDPNEIDKPSSMSRPAWLLRSRSNRVASTACPDECCDPNQESLRKRWITSERLRRRRPDAITPNPASANENVGTSTFTITPSRAVPTGDDVHASTTQTDFSRRQRLYRSCFTKCGYEARSEGTKRRSVA